MLLVALLIGVAIIVQAVFGLALPAVFVRVVGEFQTPPVIYVAAFIRLLFGVVLIVAAPASRLPRSLTVLGVLIALTGVLTPFFGTLYAQMVLRAWAEGGAAVVRIWASLALAVGVFIVYATAPGRRA